MKMLRDPSPYFSIPYLSQYVLFDIHPNHSVDLFIYLYIYIYIYKQNFEYLMVSSFTLIIMDYILV